MLQELGKQNPELLQQIQANQGAFMQMLAEPAAEGEDDPMAAMLGALGGGGGGGVG